MMILVFFFFASTNEQSTESEGVVEALIEKSEGGGEVQFLSFGG